MAVVEHARDIYPKRPEEVEGDVAARSARPLRRVLHTTGDILRRSGGAVKDPIINLASAGAAIVLVRFLMENANR